MQAASDLWFHGCKSPGQEEKISRLQLIAKQEKKKTQIARHFQTIMDPT